MTTPTPPEPPVDAVVGDAPPADAPPADPPPPSGDEPPADADQLGDAGKKALDAWKARAKRAEQALADAGIATKNQARKEAEGEQSELEKSLMAKANARIVRSEIRAAAAGKLADPKDALVYLQVDKFDVDEDGEVDSDEVAAAIEELLKNKPYLAAATAKRFQGTGDGGAQRNAGGPKQVTETELKTMTPEQIVKAQNEGRLSSLLGG